MSSEKAVMRMTKRDANKYRRRLLKLATFLRALPRKRFHYGSWVGGDWMGAPDLSCGTSACALGWATTIPEFRKLGLELTVLGTHDDGSHYGCVGINGDTGEDNAAETVFGLNSDEMCFLFIPGWSLGDLGKKFAPDGDATPKMVARHIERFVAKWRPELEVA